MSARNQSCALAATLVVAVGTLGATSPVAHANPLPPRSEGVSVRYSASCASRRSVAATIECVFGPIWGPGAIRVARCESGLRLWARNGQYVGIFQMGERERAVYAHGEYSSVWAQVVAAHRYFVRAGWGPWSCKP